MKSALAKTVLFLILLILVTTSVLALGITPSRKIVDFKSDLDREFSFKIVNNDNKDLDVKIYPRGELAKYVSVEASSMHISSSQHEAAVKYKVNMPYSERKPGINQIDVVVEEMPSSSSEQVAVIGRAAVVHQLQLKSQYEGKYLRAMLTTNNPDENEDLMLTFALFNEGAEDISSLTAEVEVLNSNSESVGTVKYTFSKLSAGATLKETRSFSNLLTPGDYRAKAKIYYDGKTINAETSFTVGGSYIEIEGISSSDFKLGKINRLDVAIYNRYYEEIKNVFAEITVKDTNGNELNKFRTISSSTPASSGNTLSGYWDTSNLAIGTYNLLVKVMYGKESTETEFEVNVQQDKLITGKTITGSAIAGAAKKRDPMISILTLAFIILVIINIWLITYLKKGKNPPQIPPSTMNILLFANLVLIGIIKNL